MHAHDRRELGRTGVSLTQLGFGAGAIGELWAPIPDDQASGTIDAAWENGIRYFDVAPWYGRGLAERRVGNALRLRPRSDFVLSTKVGRILSAPENPSNFDSSPWVGGLPFAATHDYTYDGLMRSFEDSLQRLGINRVDLLLIHDLDHWHFQTDEAVAAHMRDLVGSGYRALEELKADGRVRGIGAGINQSRTMPQFLDSIALDFFLIALCYTLLDQSALVHMRRAQELGMGFVVGGVFNSGILATGAVPGAKFNYSDATEDVLEQVRRIETVADKYNVPLGSAALQFPLGDASVASVIPGALSSDQVAQNVAAIEHVIPDEFWTELKSSELLSADVSTPRS
jgi:D-threo-aldose 1-dehydrogenase